MPTKSCRFRSSQQQGKTYTLPRIAVDPHVRGKQAAKAVKGFEEKVGHRATESKSVGGEASGVGWCNFGVRSFVRSGSGAERAVRHSQSDWEGLFVVG